MRDTYIHWLLRRYIHALELGSGLSTLVLVPFVTAVSLWARRAWPCVSTQQRVICCSGRSGARAESGAAGGAGDNVGTRTSDNSRARGYTVNRTAAAGGSSPRPTRDARRVGCRVRSPVRKRVTSRRLDSRPVPGIVIVSAAPHGHIRNIDKNYVNVCTGDDDRQNNR